MSPPIRRHSTGILQAITAGNDFDGTLPTGAGRAGEIETFPAAAAGGLFDFGQANSVVVSGVRLFLGGQTSWDLKIVSVSGVEYTWLTGTTESSFIAAGKDIELPLLPGEKLKLTTTGASTAMEALITVRGEGSGGARHP